MSDIAILARGATRAFGDFLAVDDVDLDIERASVYGFLGPNGSGKSTTIRMLCGLLTPTRGTIEVLGLRVPEEIEALRSRFGYMTQKFSLYDDLTVQENLEFVATVYGLRRKHVRERVAALLRRYRLDERARQRAGSMSGGQRQRLALAAATVHEPELLFLDEPTSAVDPENRRDFWEGLFDLAAEGTTILVSTHLMDEAERCHGLAILSAGRKVADGTPAELTAALSGQVLKVQTSFPRRVRDAVLKISGVRSAAQIGKVLRVLIDQDSTALDGELRQALQALDGKASMEPAEPNLEDVFVIATARSHRQ